MKCKFCGKRYKKHDTKCPQCGRDVNAELSTDDLIDAMGEIHNEMGEIGKMREKRQRRSHRFFLVVLVIVLCVGAGLGAMYYFGGNLKSSTEQVTVEEQQPSVMSGVAGERVDKFFGAGFSNVSITDENSAQTALENMFSDLGMMGEKMTFRLEHKMVLDKDTFYRFSQVVNGLDVYGGEAIVVADNDGTPKALRSSLVQTSGLDFTADMESSKATTAISEYIDKMVDDYCVKSGIQISPTEKVICNFEGKTYLAYMASVSGYNVKSTYVAYDVFVDADNGAGIFVSDTSSFVEGEEVEEIEEPDIQQTEQAAIAQSANPAEYTISTVNDRYNWNDESKTASREEISKADIEAGNVTPYVTDVKLCTDKAYAYFANRFEWRGFDGQNAPFFVYLNGNEYVKDQLPPEKALYAGNKLMLIETNMATAKADPNVIAHEYTHGVMYHLAHLSGTTAKNENAAIAEGLADIFAELMEGPAPDWIHGGRNLALKEAGYFTEHPQGAEIGNISDVYAYGHILSHAAYRMHAEGIGTKKLGELYFRTLCLMTKTSTLSDFRTALELSAKHMEENGILSDVQFKIVVNAMEATQIPAVRLYQSEVESIGDASMEGDIPENELIPEEEVDPNEQIIE